MELNPFINVEKQEERIKICSSCPFMNKNICTKCWCWVEVKARLKKSKCPEGKWLILEEDKHGNAE